MCFQNYKFSDDRKEGHGDPTEAGRKVTHMMHQQVKNLKGGPDYQDDSVHSMPLVQ